MSTEIVTLDPKQFGIEESKAAEIAAQFKPMLDKMVELETEYNEVIKLPIETAGPVAKQLRLKYVKVRTGTEKIHKDQKAFYLSAGRFVDGWKNAQFFASQGIEARLEDIENHAANLEKARIAESQAMREQIISQYNVDTTGLKLGEMSQSVFDSFLLGTKTAYENRIEAERIAEEQRLAAIEAEKARIEAQRIENERLKAEAAEREEAARKEREAASAALAAERAEAARLAKIEADKLAAIEEANRKAREKAAAELKAEQDKAAKIAAELKARKDAEAKAEADRIAAEKKAAKAPVKEKLRVAVSSLTLHIPESEVSVDIMAKFNGFKQWALAQIESL
jgi:colicin import membrane protein